MKTEGLLIAAEFPPVEGYPAFDDEETITVFSELQDATRGVRDLRSSSSVPPRDRVKVTFVVPPSRVESFSAHAHIVQQMAGIGDYEVLSSGKRPPNAASITVGPLRIFVHNISDDAAERSRAARSLEEIEKQIAGKKSKLGNDKFVANADPEVVAAERKRLDELLAEQAHLGAHLAELQ